MTDIRHNINNMTKRLYKNILPALLLLIMQQVCQACSDNATNDSNNGTTDEVSAYDWADKSMWFEGDKRLDNADASQPDVFYVLPTCVKAWTDSTGTIHYNADPTLAKHRKAWQLSAELADTIFATHANLYLPYYRQVVFEGLEGEPAEKAYATATRDVLDAFDYYLKHYNHGRRFILAGYSQGGMMVKEILKHIDDDTYSRLIAAYVVGFGVTAADTVTQAGHRQSHIRLATDSTATGVTINFNSVTTTDAICPLLCRNNIGCINPVSWSTDNRTATLLAVGEQAKADDTRFPYATAAAPSQPGTPVTVTADQNSHVLIVNGIDAQRYFYAGLQQFFPVGNLHLQELYFYGDLLRHNVLLRSRQ